MKINIRTMTFVSVYVAVMLVMNFTPQFGYINFGIGTLTLMLIPVAIMTVHYGWKGAAFAWTFFGLLSVLATPIYGGDTLAFFGWKGVVIAYLLGRMSAGAIMILIILAFKGFEVSKWARLNIKTVFWIKSLIIGLLTPILNALFVLSYVYLIHSQATIFWVFFISKWINFSVEIPTTTIVTLASVPLTNYLVQKEKEYKRNAF